MLKRLRSSTLLRNSSWMMAGQGSSVIMQGFYFVALARLLGATEYGLLAGATALIAFGSQYSSLGAGFIFLRHVSPNLSRFRLYWGYVLTTTVVGGVVVVAILTLMAHWVMRDLNPLAVVCLALGDSLFAQITAGASRVFQTYERMQYSALTGLLTNALRLVMVTCLLKTVGHANVTQWAIASMTVSAFACLAALGVVTKVFGKPVLSFSLLRQHTVEGLLFSSTVSTSSAYNDIDKVLLSHYGMNAANGVYSMAYKGVDTAFMAVRSIHNAAFPRFCREGAQGVVATRKFALSLLGKTLWVSLGISALLFFCAPLVPLIIGKAFTPSVVALRWLCIIPVLRAFHLSAGDGLAGAGFQKYRFTYELGAAVFNFSVNLWLIPRYLWQGAAVSSIVTDGALAVVSWTVLNMATSRALKRQEAAPTMA